MDFHDESLHTIESLTIESFTIKSYLSYFLVLYQRYSHILSCFENGLSYYLLDILELFLKCVAVGEPPCERERPLALAQ